MLKRWTGLLMILGPLALLSGCTDNASRSRPAAFDPALRPLIQTIVIMPVPEPSSAELGLWDIPPASGLVTHLRLASEGGQLRQALARSHFDFAAAMTRALRDKLTAGGFTVVLPGPRPAAAQHDFLAPAAYATLATGAAMVPAPSTAYLDVFAWRAGYATGGPDGPGDRPYLGVAVRLVRDGAAQTFYDQLLEYGSTQRTPPRYIPAPGSDYVPGMVEPKGHPGQLGRGLEAGVDAVAGRIAADLGGAAASQPGQ